MFISAAFGAVVGVAHSALEHLATLLTPIAGGVAGTLAIVVFTLLVRLAISPLTYLQVRAERRRAALAPQLEELRRKHRDDRMALATETLALQRAAGVGPFAGLLPGLAQTPFFMIMFRLVHPTAAVAAGVLAGTLIGVPLTAHLFSTPSGAALFAALLALGAALAWQNSRRLRRAAALQPPTAPPPTPSAHTAPKAAAQSAPPNSSSGRTTSAASKSTSAPTAPGASGSAKITPGAPASASSRSARKAAAPAGTAPAATGQTAPAGSQSARTAPAATGRTAPPPSRSARIAPTATGRAAPSPSRSARTAQGPSAQTAPAPGDGVAAGIARVMPWMPYLTVAVMAYLPLAGAIYLLTSTAWTALENAIWRRPRTMSNQ
jgi:YidC/Oxa1 family membrane protein insertase